MIQSNLLHIHSTKIVKRRHPPVRRSPACHQKQVSSVCISSPQRPLFITMTAILFCGGPIIGSSRPSWPTGDRDTSSKRSHPADQIAPIFHWQGSLGSCSRCGACQLYSTATSTGRRAAGTNGANTEFTCIHSWGWWRGGQHYLLRVGRGGRGGWR